MEKFTETMIAMLIATSLEQTATLALQALPEFVESQAACLLLWDEELARYIVGDTSLQPKEQGSAVRRRALSMAQQAHDVDPITGRCIEPAVFYQPFNLAGQHVGAFLCLGIDHVPQTTDERFGLFIQGVSRALYSVTCLEQREREGTRLKAEQERLEQTLQALEHQQRTIDRLLANERQLSASLEAKVEERTVALRQAQEKLIQSEKLAVIGQLASSLAHELNNPLQAIRSGLGLIADEVKTGDLQRAGEDLSVIQAELERIEVIFRQMLDFYRPVSYEYVPLDLNAICQGVQVLTRKRLQQANITLCLELTEHLPLTCGDSNQIKQVLLNLLLNAGEAMQNSGGSVTLKTTFDAKYVYLGVTDNGPGIPSQHQAHLFEPLFTTKTRGLGLGLAISREIVERHAGTIRVESIPAVYTRFTLSLPVKERCDDRQ